MTNSYNRNPLIPNSHADMLDSIIRRLSNATIESTFTRFLFEEEYNNKYGDDNLDINVLDLNSLRKIIDILRTTEKKSVPEKPIHRKAYLYHDLILEKKVILKSFDMMKQSIYTSRFRINDTNRIRKFFHTKPSYVAGVLISSLDQILLKADLVMGTMQNRLLVKSHFLWWLILYERMLTHSVDIGYIVQMMFHKHYLNHLVIKAKEDAEAKSKAQVNNGTSG